MKKNLWIVIVILFGVILLAALLNGKKIKLLYDSLNAFKPKRLAGSLQHMAEIQPTNKIERGDGVFEFQRAEASLPQSFFFQNEEHAVDGFLDKTKTSGLLVIQKDTILHESYRLGSDEHTLFSSNSMGKSFVSALMGIAIGEGCIGSVDDPVSDYIPQMEGTEVGEIPIKACLQMASGLDFDEDTDMNGYSMKTLMGIPAMNIIAKLSLQEKPFTYRRYLSINTEILGEIISKATGQHLAAYMQEKLWSKIGPEQDAYWTLNNGKELAMGGLSVSLRDFARFGRLYLNGGNWNGEQIVPSDWVKDSVDISADYSKPGANHDSYNAIGYGYQWWVPEGSEGEFLAIGVYGQWLYVNPARNTIIVKTSADPDFMSKDYELMHIELFRAITEYYDGN